MLAAAAVAASAWSLGGCADPDGAEGGALETAGQEAAAPSLPDDIFERVRAITLEEDTAVINADPRVTVDPQDGSFVIADAQEQRIRIYDRSGSFVTEFGRAGDGPGEFQMPVKARRLPDRGIAVTDLAGTVIEFDSSGSTFQRAFSLSHRLAGPLRRQERLPDGRILASAAAPGHEDPEPLLHVWDPVSDTIVRSFFPTPGDDPSVRGVLRTVGGAAFDLRADTIAAVSALTDTLFLFTTGGEELGRMPLPFRAFRQAASYDASPFDIAGFDAWLNELDLIHEVFWLDDGSFLFQYERPGSDGSGWNLLGASRDGERLFDLANTPELLAVHGDLLYFIDPEHTLVSNRWVEVRLRR